MNLLTKTWSRSLCKSGNKNHSKIMDNLHVRLHFNLVKRRESNATAKKSVMKLVKLQNLVAKCCKAWTI